MSGDSISPEAQAALQQAHDVIDLLAYRRGYRAGHARALRSVVEMCGDDGIREDWVDDGLREEGLLTPEQIAAEKAESDWWEAQRSAMARAQKSIMRAALIAELAEEDGTAQFAHDTAEMLFHEHRCPWGYPEPSMGPIERAVAPPETKKPKRQVDIELQHKIIVEGYAANETDGQILTKLAAANSRIILKDIASYAKCWKIERPETARIADDGERAERVERVTWDQAREWAHQHAPDAMQASDRATRLRAINRARQRNYQPPFEIVSGIKEAS